MRRSHWSLVVFLGVMAVALLALSQDGRLLAAQAADPAQLQPEDARIVRGFEIAPVPLRVRRNNRELIGLGSYIVNAQAACNDCHTNPPFAAGGDPYLGQPEHINTDGYLAGGVAFGPFVSRNITPHINGMPAGLTFNEFKTTLRTGHDPEELHPDIPLQVMPWPVYGKMTDRDLRAIYEYLSAIPAID